MREEFGSFAFVIFLIVNVLVTVIYLIIGLIQKKTNRRMIMIRCVVMLCAPGVGPLMFFFSWLLYRIFFHKEVDLSDVIFSKERTKELVRTNEERERNYVPLEEALEVSDKDELRNLILGVAQSDYQTSLASIRTALNSEDTETAHYAASVLQDALNDFRMMVQKEHRAVWTMTEESEKNERVEKLRELIKTMNTMLEQHVFTDIEQRDFVEILDSDMELFYQVDPEQILSEDLENVSLRLLEIEDYENCEKWCNRAAARFPEDLSSYTSRIKLYFNSGRKEEFFKTLEELKQTSIIIDSETLALIRAFQ